MRFLTFTFILLLTLVSSLNAQSSVFINNFSIKNSLINNNKIAVIVTDSLNVPQESINGTFNFTFNGFNELLEFNDGIASSNLELEKSAFLYIKHENDKGGVSQMYYIIKNEAGLNPIKISWYILLAIPIGLILLGYMFRKLIGLFIFMLMGYIYFNYSKGLSFSTFLESIFDGLKNLF